MLNSCILMGRLTKEPELRTTQSGVSVTTFTLAVDRERAEADGTRQADFIDITAWRSTAEFVHKYFRKGQLVAVEGRLQSRKWEDKTGNKRTAYEVVADRVHFAERKNDASPSAQQGFAAPPSAFQEIDDDGELPFLGRGL